MDKILQIEVDDDVYNDAENLARDINTTVTELLSDYVVHLSEKTSATKKSNEVNTYDELVEALHKGMDDFENGRVITHEVMMEKLKRYARK